MLEKEPETIHLKVYNKFSYTESSYMNVDFNEQGELDRLVMWPETTGKVTPLYLARRTAYYLSKFRWYGPLRPMEPMEVFDYPAEMADLARQNLLGTMSKDALTMRGQALGRPTAIPKGAMIPGLARPSDDDTDLPENDNAMPEDENVKPEDESALPPDESTETDESTDDSDTTEPTESSESPESSDTPDTTEDSQP